jgi:hypothetical protein
MKQHSSLLTAILAAAAVFLLPKPGSAAQITPYYIPTIPPVTLSFNAFDPARARIDDRWLLDRLVAALQAHSVWPLSTTGETTVELSGLRTHLDQDQSRIVFEYVHMARNRKGDEWGETLTIPVAYEIQSWNDFSIIRLQPLPKADLAKRATPGIFFLPTPKLRPVTELFDDFSAIMDSARTLELRRWFLVEGQEETGAPPEVCIENFERRLGRYGYAKDEERVFDPVHDNVFLYRTAEQSVPLKIAAFPFRGGSRVFYKAWVPFELRADGTVSGYDRAPALKSAVQWVLDDPGARPLNGGFAGIHDRDKIRSRF